MAALLCAAAVPSAAKDGILLLAPAAPQHQTMRHAVARPWREDLEEVAAEVGRRFPSEILFGATQARSVEEAIARLAKKGAARIAAVPLVPSSESQLLADVREILARPRPAASPKIALSSAFDAHPLISDMLLERAWRVTLGAPSETVVVVIADGFADDAKNNAWAKVMAVQADFIRTKGGYAAAAAFAYRDDARAETGAAAREAFRAYVALNAKTKPVVVVPLFIGAGDLAEKVEKELANVPHALAAPLLPHPNIAAWVEAQSAEVFRSLPP